MADYSLDDLPLRADSARAVHRDYVDGLLGNYTVRKQWREKFRVRPIGFCGMGRAGKDTAAEYVCTRTGGVYPQSASRLMLPLVAHMVGETAEQAWENRHANRIFWISACHALRGSDYSLLVRMCLGAGDVAVGIRGRLELASVLKDGIIDLAVWIDRPSIPTDPTVEYGPGDCDVLIPNHGSLLDLYRKLDRLIPHLFVAN